MSLILQPSFDEKSRAEIEAHIEEVRARRLTAAIEYRIGVNAKLDQEADKVKRKMTQHLTMLGKELVRFDKLDALVSKRVNVLTTLYQELGLINEVKEK